jgi:SNF2 family DNA or RNA helicase
VASGDAAVDFWLKGYPRLPASWERYGAVAPKVRVRAPLKPRIRVGMSSNRWFELDAEFCADDQLIDLGAVRLWLNSGRRFIRLPDGSLTEGDRKELEPIVGLLEESGALPAAPRTRIPIYQAGTLELIANVAGAAEVDARARNMLSELRDREGIAPVPAPRGLRATLRHYQEAGLAWLWFLHRHGLSGILADDMGLGKTIQALSLLQKAREEEGVKSSLVIAPTSVLANWEREIQRFTPDLKVTTWHGQNRRERASKLKEDDIVLTSYALVRRDAAALSRFSWRYVILDEAQNIKNADSATAQACKSLPADARLALTGTPLENRLSELWSIFDFLMAGFLGAAAEFAERYEAPPAAEGSLEARERLRLRVRPFILRRLKDDVAQDLPPKTESVTYCEMEPAQAALYREVLEDSRRKVYDAIERVGFGRSRLSILAALLRLRQVCCDPRLLKLPPETALPPSTKFARFWELVDDLVAEGHRALIFSQFVEMLTLLTREADSRKLSYLYLDGRTRDRMARVDQFNSPQGPPLFFISLRAGGTGLNLTAADYVLHYDPWWNPAVEAQATDRTHRIGQKKAVISYKLIVRGTVEEKILSLQQGKKSLAEGVLGTDGGLGKVLTESDVEELLRPD